MDLTDRELNKFYTRVRQDLSDAADQNNFPEKDIIVNKPDKKFACNDGIKDDRMFGKVTKEDFLKILNKYESQQAKRDFLDEPITCDNIVGGNFDKLLCSIPGFHNTGSTDYLINNLNINDVNRNSLLGGYSNYNLLKGEDILTMRRLHHRKYIKDCLARAWASMNSSKLEYHLVQQDLNKAYELDPSYGDTIASMAKFDELNGHVDRAIKGYEDALKMESLEQREYVLKNLVQCLYNEGFRLFTRNKFIEARELLERALKYNPEDSGVILYHGLCTNNINMSTLYTQKAPTYRNPD